jgi:hypothetical protein
VEMADARRNARKAGAQCRAQAEGPDWGGAVRRYPAHCVHGPDGEGGESGLFVLLGRMVDVCAGRGKRVSGYQRALVEWDEMVVKNAPILTISALTHIHRRIGIG